MNIRRFAAYQLPAIVYAGIIFALSSLHKLPTPDLGFDFQDKLAHLVEYFVLMILVFRALVGNSSRSGKPVVYFLAAAITILYAVSDEYHQSFVPGRHADVYDIVADSAGVFLAGVVLFFMHRGASSAS